MRSNNRKMDVLIGNIIILQKTFSSKAQKKIVCIILGIK